MYSLSQDNSRENAENRSTRSPTEWTSSDNSRFEISPRNDREFEHNSHVIRDEENSEDDSSGSMPDWDILVAGYKACAEEAIRFLVEDENLPPSHPLVTGLWQHLSQRQAILDAAEILGSADEPQNSAQDSAIGLSVENSFEETHYETQDTDFNTSQLRDYPD